MIKEENILFVQLGFLGDVILSSPVISNLKREFSEAKITVLTTPLAKDLVLYHPDVAEVITFDKRKSESGLKGLISLAKKLKSKNFSQVYSAHKSWRTSLLLFLSGIKKRYGFKEAKGRFLYTKVSSRSEYKHDVLRNLALLKNIGISPEDCIQDMTLGISSQCQKEADELIKEISDKKKLIAIAPGSVWATKRWTPKGFADVCNLLSRDYEFCLIGGPSDKESADEIMSLSNAKILNLVGKCSLLTSGAIISQSALLLTNDSAPLHMGSALKIPTVAIFCATIPEFGYGPWRNENRIIEVKNLDCRPCGRHGGNICPTGTKACQINISPLKVVEAIKELLTRNNTI